MRFGALRSVMGLVLVSVTVAQAGPQHAQALGTLVRIQMQGQRVGWAVAGSPRGYIVLRTENGGRHWQNVSPAGFTRHAPYDRNEDIYDSSVGSAFLDTQFGWVAVVGQVHGHAAMRVDKTLDGGRHWGHTHFPVQNVGESVNVQFIDRRHGFILALSDPAAGLMEKQVYRTGDGGMHWQRMSRPDREGKESYAFYPTGMTFRSAVEGWVTATYHGEPDAPFMHTRDAGRTWHVQPLPVPWIYDDGYADTEPPQFFGPRARQGVFVARLVNNNHPKSGRVETGFFATRDGGRHWRLMHPVPVRDGDSFDSIDFLDAEHSWAVVDDRRDRAAKLYATANGGRAWRRMTAHLSPRRALPPETTTQHAQLDFITPQDGWALIVTHVSVGPEAFDLLRTARRRQTLGLAREKRPRPDAPVPINQEIFLTPQETITALTRHSAMLCGPIWARTRAGASPGRRPAGTRRLPLTTWPKTPSCRSSSARNFPSPITRKTRV